LSNDVVGPARFIVTDVGNGRTRVSGVFDGCKPNHPLMTAKFLAEKHLAAESGSMSFPFPSGTGLPGLIDAIENNKWQK